MRLFVDPELPPWLQLSDQSNNGELSVRSFASCLMPEAVLHLDRH